jgi:hypothetical protein
MTSAKITLEEVLPNSDSCFGIETGEQRLRSSLSDAQIASAILDGDAGVDERHIHPMIAGYRHAAAQAQRACDYVLNRTLSPMNVRSARALRGAGDESKTVKDFQLSDRSWPLLRERRSQESGG